MDQQVAGLAADELMASPHDAVDGLHLIELSSPPEQPRTGIFQGGKSAIEASLQTADRVSRSTGRVCQVGGRVNSG